MNKIDTKSFDDPIGPVFANSWAWLMRNVLLERLKLIPPFSTDVVKFSRTNARPQQGEDIPYLGVYLIPDEELKGYGKNNIGPAQFEDQVHIGFSYIIQNNDPEICEDLLDRAHWAIMSLLHDPDWNKWPDTMGSMRPHNPDNVMIQGITNVARRNVFGNIGKTNETPVGEMQMEWAVTLGAISFEPILPDYWESINVKAIYPWPEDPNRQPIIAEWTIDTTPAEILLFRLWADRNGQPAGTAITFMTDVMSKTGPMPAGTIQILIDGIVVASGPADVGLPAFANGLAYTTSSLDAGIHMVTANFVASDGIYENADADEWTQTVI
jgi:hypothetical protein